METIISIAIGALAGYAVYYWAKHQSWYPSFLASIRGKINSLTK